MCQNSKGNSGNFDYSQLTANTGLANVSTPNPNLDGTGTTALVLTAGSSGTIVRSVTIKSAPGAGSSRSLSAPLSFTSFSQEGMVRLFISNNASPTPTITLYKEIPIPAVPAIPAVPLPLPVFPTFETILPGDLKLNAGYSLLASTQFGDSFNIIAEGLDYAYPGTLPAMCCTLIQEVANTGVGVVNTADPYDFSGGGAVVNVFQAGASANGSLIKAITIKAQQSTHEGMVRLYIYDGTTYWLMREVHIPQTEQSAYVPSFKQVLEMNFNLEAGYYIAASTQNAEGFAITIEGEDCSYPA